MCIVGRRLDHMTAQTARRGREARRRCYAAVREGLVYLAVEGQIPRWDERGPKDVVDPWRIPPRAGAPTPVDGRPTGRLRRTARPRR